MKAKDGRSVVGLGVIIPEDVKTDIEKIGLSSIHSSRDNYIGARTAIE
jgi:hypothetical protein